MTVEGRSLVLTYDNGSTYLTADDIGVSATSYGYDVLLKSEARNGYAIFNDAAKAVLYPNATAKPVKADSYLNGGASTSNKNNYVTLEFDGTEVHKLLLSDSTGEQDGLTASAITGSTSATVIRYHLRINSLFVVAALHDAKLTLYFNRYSCMAQTVGNGVTSASVSDATPWDGDSVTFSATLKSGATWHGWYSDAACTQLVSTAQTYTTTAADLTLYAYATKDTSGTGIYLKQNGAYTQAQVAYKKVNGVWVQQTDTAALKTEIQTGRYKYGG